MNHNSRYAYLWMPLYRATEAILWDQLKPRSLVFIPDLGKVSETLTLRMEFDPLEKGDMAVLAFNRAHLPRGYGCNGQSIAEITGQVMDAYLASNRSALNQIVRVAQTHPLKFVQDADQEIYTQGFQPFAHGLVAVGTVANKPTKSLNVFRTIAQIKGLRLAHGSTCFDLAADLERVCGINIQQAKHSTIAHAPNEGLVIEYMSDRISQRDRSALLQHTYTFVNVEQSRHLDQRPIAGIEIIAAQEEVRVEFR